jgi:hypothetical protein
MLDHPELPNINAWRSLLGLLSPWEYFVTVDHSVLWQRHVAWAKPKGEDLRQYVTQRFASNMIVLSLMLGAQISTFFNSCKELTEMRELLGTETYGDLKFWIGIVIALDAVVTIMALVATFTLWGMVSSISDSNTHALLRSSIGQYVTSLPPRFVVAALYLFVFWLLLFFMDLMSGPSRIVLMLVVMFLFFEVVVPLSAFGRLIIHTGAMAKRRVLEEDFEKELLPSGLHVSLLIRATGQRRKYASAVYQYRKKEKSSDSIRQEYEKTSFVSEPSPGSVRSNRLNSEDEEHILESFRKVQPDFRKKPPMSSYTKQGHKRTVSGDVYFPRPSVLNSVNSSDLKGVVEKALSESEREEDSSTLGNIMEEGISPGSYHVSDIFSPKDGNASMPFEDLDNNECKKLESSRNDGLRRLSPAGTSPGSQPTNSSPSSTLRSQSSPSLVRGDSSKALLAEWEEENNVRNLYQMESPAALIMEDKESNGESKSHRRRPSFLNRVRGLGSLRNLIAEESLDASDSSVDGEDLEDEDLEQDKLVGRFIERKESSNSVLESPIAGDLHKKNVVESRCGEQERLLDRRQNVLSYHGKSNH